MHFDPGSKNIVLSLDDLADVRVADGWALAVGDGVAIQHAHRHGAALDIMQIPRASALAYLPAFMVDHAVRRTQEDTAGDATNTWGGWSAELGEEDEEW